MTTKPANTRPPRRLRRELVETLCTVVIAIGLTMLAHTVLFQPFTIPSSSMEPTFVTGDYIVVSKFAYGWSGASPPVDLPMLHGRLFGRGPKRGDVVVFRLPRDPRLVWVKRVIGLPGDHVRLREGVVFVNGRPLTTTPLSSVQDHDTPERQVTVAGERLPEGRTHLLYAGDPEHEGETTGVYLVPPKAYFVMGDNRDNSLDSRWPHDQGVGFLPAEDILGKAEVVLASWTPGSSLFKPWTWLNLDPTRFFKLVR